MPSDSRKVLRTAALSIAVVAAAALIVFAARPLLLLFAGVLAALTFRGAAEPIARRTRAPYGLCLALLVLLFLGCTVATVVWAAPKIADQARTFARDLPRALHAAAAKVQSVAPAANLGDKVSPDPSHVAKITQRVLSASVELLGAAVVVFFVGLFGAAQPGVYSDAALQLFPEDMRPRVDTVLGEVRVKLTRWLLGRLGAMVFMGVSSWIAFLVLKIPLAGFLALLTGALAFVEYAGAVTAAIPPIAFALAESPKKALMVAGVYTVLHVIEGYVLTPLVARAAVRIPPAVTLAGQVILGTFLGAIGLTFSTPLLVVGITSVATIRKMKRAEEKRESRGRLSLA